MILFNQLESGIKSASKIAINSPLADFKPFLRAPALNPFLLALVI